MLVNVQFLRFAAAMLVVFYHASAHLLSTGVDQGGFFALSEAIGFAGVDIFFVISGFIMAHTTMNLAGSQISWEFARRRVARIYSGYWPFFLIAIALYALISPAHLAEANLLRSALLWPTYANHLLIAVSWTLIFEMIFYLLFTLLLLLSPSRRRLFILLALVAVAAWSVSSQFVRQAYDPAQLYSISLAEYYLLSPYLAEFLAGAVVANWLSRATPARPWAWLIVGTALFIGGGWINLAFFSGNIEQAYFMFYRVIMFGGAALMIIAALVGLERAGTRAPLHFSLVAGGASYAVYLSHTLFFGASSYLGFNAWLGQFEAWQAQAVFFVYCWLILAFGMAYHQWLERPLHHGFRWLLRLDRPATDGRASARDGPAAGHSVSEAKQSMASVTDRTP